MKRFKLIFHIVYILITLIVLCFSIDILMHTEEYLSKVKLSAYIRFPKYVMGIFLFISILMLTEYIMQQLRIRNIKEGIEDLQEEVKELKAKLYDKGQGILPEEMDSEEGESVSDDDDDPNEA